VLTAEPSVCSRVLKPNDKFVIFASDGLWEHLTNQEAAEIVHNNPRTVRRCFSHMPFFLQPSLVYEKPLNFCPCMIEVSKIL